MNSCELTVSITVLANALASKLNVSELALLGSALIQLGDTLTTISLQRSFCENSSDKEKA